MKKPSDTAEHMSSRKSDHIELAFRSRIESSGLDLRFNYEPVLNAHPTSSGTSIEFLGKKLNHPLWISSMTGGTEKARVINQNLARLCGKYGLGMGLGSCRPLLESNERIEDFQMREFMGDEYPLFSNLGIAQVEELIAKNELDRVHQMIDVLEADGLIIHINPLQEWAQPEGDRIATPPIETIEAFLSKTNIPTIVKEVGQGMGPKSLKALLNLPLAALEFGAAGGTNFTQLEIHRSASDSKSKQAFTYVGHTALEMVQFINQIHKNDNSIQCKEVIISGGIKDYLDGYHLMELCCLPSIYGQASAFLKYAVKSYEELEDFFLEQMQGLLMAKNFLQLRTQD